MNRTVSRAPDAWKSSVHAGCCFVCHRFQSHPPYGGQPLEVVLGIRTPAQVTWG